MPHFSPDILRPIWERALEAEIGISVATNDPKALRHELLVTRKTFPDHETFDTIITYIPEGQGVVFLVHKSAELPDA